MNKKILLIILIILLAYSNIFFNDFAFDDIHFIVEDSNIKSVNIVKFFTEDVRGVYRPFKTLAIAISYKLYGLNPVGYHFNSLIVHILASILVYKISMQIFKKENTALISALLFATHPIHTEAITFMTVNFDVIGIVFALAAFFFYMKEKTYLPNIFFLLAAFTYEITLILPLLLILYDFSFKKLKIKKYISYFAILFFYFFIRFFIIKVVARNTGYPGGSFFVTMLTITKAIILYIKLLILPIGLTLGHTFSLATSIFEPMVLISILLIIALIAAAFFTKKKIIKFSILWFFISLLPVLNIIPIQTPFEERYAYLASVGFCLLLAWGITQIKKQHVKIIIVIILLLAYTAITIDRNQDWKNDHTLFKKTVELSPEYSKGYINLGYENVKRGEYIEGEKHLKKAIELNPKASKAYSNLAWLYLLQNKNEEAIEEAENAIEQEQNDRAHTIMCIAKLNLGKIEEGKQNCREAVNINPYNQVAKDVLQKLE